ARRQSCRANGLRRRGAARVPALGGTTGRAPEGGPAGRPGEGAPPRGQARGPRGARGSPARGAGRRAARSGRPDRRRLGAGRGGHGTPVLGARGAVIRSQLRPPSAREVEPSKRPAGGGVRVVAVRPFLVKTVVST